MNEVTPPSIETRGEEAPQQVTLSQLRKKYEEHTLFLDSELQTGHISQEDYDKAIQSLSEIIYPRGAMYSQEELQEVNKEYTREYQNILNETGLQLSQLKEVADFQITAYKMLNIDRYTTNNSSLENFSKGIIDALVVDNYAMIEQIKKVGIEKIISDIYDTISSWEGLKSIAEALGESVWNLFSGNAYERGKAVGELGLITTGTGAVGTGLKMLGKKAIKTGLHKTGAGLIHTGNILLVPTKIISYPGKQVKLGFHKAREFLPNFNPIEVSHHVQLGNKVKKGVELSHEEISDVISHIDENFPALPIISHFSKGDHFESIIFTGVKGLNDSISPIFTDEVIATFKKSVLKKYPGVVPVYNNYKNFLLKAEKGAVIPSQEELSHLLEKSYQSAYKKLPENIQAKISNNPLGVHSQKGKITGESQEVIMHDIATARMNLESKALGNNLSIEDTLHLEKDLTHKYHPDSEHIGTYYTETGRVEGLSIKNGILQKIYKEKGRTRTENIHLFDHEGKLNIEIITMVRKGKIPKEMPLYQDVRKYLDGLIANGEFIAPYLKNSHLPAGQVVDSAMLDAYSKLIQNLQNGTKINISHFEKLFSGSYKGHLSKTALYSRMNGPGEAFFIDIMDMGSINMKDISRGLGEFQTIKKELQNQLSAGKIDQAGFEHLVSSAHRKMILNSGAYMTDKFQNFIQKIEQQLEQIYPGKKIHINVGGDELKVFVEGVNLNTAQTQQAIQGIFKALEQNSISGRIAQKTVTKNDIKISQRTNNNTSLGEKIMDSLDTGTKFSKAIENRLSVIKNNIEGAIKRGLSREDTLKVMKAYNEIQNFYITEKKGVHHIVFVNAPFGEQNIFQINQIIHPDGHFVPGSPLMKYLDLHGIGRTSPLFKQ